MADPEDGLEQGTAAQYSGSRNEELFGEAQVEQRFNDAESRVDEVVAKLFPNADDGARAAEADHLRDVLGVLLESETLKLVRQRRDDGTTIESVEAENSESRIDSMPLETFNRLFGVDEHSGDDELAEVLYEASGKKFRIETIEPE